MLSIRFQTWHFIWQTDTTSKVLEMPDLSPKVATFKQNSYWNVEKLKVNCAPIQFCPLFSFQKDSTDKKGR